MCISIFLSKLAMDFSTKYVDNYIHQCYYCCNKRGDFMVMEELNTLKRKLETQVLNEDSYDKIYETSAKIDTLLVEYYKNLPNINKNSLDNKFKKDLSY